MTAPSGKFWMAMPGVPGHPARQHHAYRHPLRDVVEGDGQHQHGGPPQAGAGPLRLIAALMQVGDRPVQRQQEQDAHPKASDRREERPPPHIRRLFHRGDQQAPDGGRHHDPRREAGQGPPDHQVQSLF